MRMATHTTPLPRAEGRVRAVAPVKSLAFSVDLSNGAEGVESDAGYL
jgi:hypothetical protein